MNHSDRVFFGQTDLQVSRLCQGTAFRHLPRADSPQSLAVLHHCLDQGVNFFDTAQAYGWGGAEEVLGRAIAGRRDEVIICTKVPGSLAPTSEGDPGERVRYTRAHLTDRLEESLHRLRTDYVDLYLLHHRDEGTPPEAIAEVMEDLVQAGKTRYWGVSNHSAAEVEAFLALAPIAGVEDYYNIAGSHCDEAGTLASRDLRRGDAPPAAAHRTRLPSLQPDGHRSAGPTQRPSPRRLSRRHRPSRRQLGHLPCYRLRRLGPASGPHLRTRWCRKRRTRRRQSPRHPPPASRGRPRRPRPSASDLPRQPTGVTPVTIVDAHIHVWTSDFDQYPLAPGFTPADLWLPSFTPDDHFAYSRNVGKVRLNLVQMTWYGLDHSYILDLIASDPETYTGTGIVPGVSDVSLADPGKTMLALAEGGIRAFRVRGGSTGRPTAFGRSDRWLDYPGYESMFRTGAEHNLALSFLMGLADLPGLIRLCRRFPETPVILDHICGVRIRDGVWPEGDIRTLCNMARYPRVMVKLGPFQALGDGEAPYLDLLPLIERIVDAFGPERIMWESDSGGPVRMKEPANDFAAAIALIRDHADFLSQSDKEQILVKTAEDFFFNR